MKIYGREDGDLKTIIPYFSLEQVHIVADLEEIDIIINFLLDSKKEQSNNAKQRKIVPSHMKDVVELKSQKGEILDIVVTVFDEVMM